MDGVRDVGTECRLPLMETALPALRWLSDKQKARFSRLMRALSDADQEIDLFEYMVQHVLKQRLTPSKNVGPVINKIYSPHPLVTEIQTVLSTVAYAGHPEGGAEEAFLKASGQFSRWGLALTVSPAEACTLEAVDHALGKLKEAAPRVKECLVRAIALSIGFDREVTLEEAELFRAVAEALDCPVPPLFARA